MSDHIKSLFESLSEHPLAHYLVHDFLPDLIVASVTFALFYWAWRALRRATQGVLERTSVDVTAQRFVQTILKYVVLGIGLITALGQVGIDMASILTSLGVIGLTIGFAAKDALSNVISGVFIFWDRPFVIGDLVEVEGQYGRVLEITMRSTRVVTNDGRMLAVPNNQVVNTTVVSYTNFPHLRLDIDVTIGLNESLHRVRDLLMPLVQDDPRFMSDPAPDFVVTALNDYNLGCQFRVWLDDETQHVSVRFALRETIYRTLNEAGVEMPYETLMIVRSEPVPVGAGNQGGSHA